MWGTHLHRKMGNALTASFISHLLWSPGPTSADQHQGTAVLTQALQGPLVPWVHPLVMQGALEGEIMSYLEQEESKNALCT